MTDRGSSDDGVADARFTLANERTFLAWVRTALALVAAGAGLTAFAPQLGAPGVREALGLLLIGLGTAVSATAHPRWQRIQTALDAGAPLPRPRLAPLLAYGLATISVILAVALLVRAL